MKHRGRGMKLLIFVVGLWAVAAWAVATRDANDQPLNVVLIVAIF